jgi:2-hydroxychromene-2-carboxylate isomerase
MSKTITFYYDFVSPYSYLAHVQLTALARKLGAKIDYKPIDVIALMGRVGNRPTTVECAAKGRYAFADLTRWAKRIGVPIVPNPHFRKIDKKPLLEAGIAAVAAGQGEAFTRAIFEGVWVKGSAFESREAIIALLNDGGVTNPEALLSAGAGMADQLEANIAEAEAHGVFGTPSMIIDGQLYFGNDRMMFVEEALAA